MPATLRMPSFRLPSSSPAAGRLLATLAALVVAVGAALAAPSPAQATTDTGARTSVHAATRPPTRAERISHARSIALRQVGDPYSYGAAGPNSFDCSGLVYYSYRHAGVSVPRTSSAQSGRARHISKRAIRSGDLMFFTSGSGVYHVAIFLRWRGGRAIMLHSPQPGQRVRVEPSWTSSWFAGTLRAR